MKNFSIPGGESLYEIDDLKRGIRIMRDLEKMNVITELESITQTHMNRRKDLEEKNEIVQELRRKGKNARLYEINTMPYHDFDYLVAYVEMLGRSVVATVEHISCETVIREMKWTFYKYGDETYCQLLKI